MKASTDNLTEDPFLFDQEALLYIADKPVVRAGIDDHRENRVMNIEQEGSLLYGEVEGADPDTPNEVEIRINPSGLTFCCDCSEAADGTVCRHIIAVLCKYADQRHGTDQLLSAADSAIRERIKRGRTEVEVTPLHGEPWFGSWRATSLGGTSHFSRSYEVTIRSLNKRANCCTCPDFAGNQLGTCKHIEAVLHKISKHPQYAQFKEQQPPFPYVYLDWNAEDGPRISLHRTANPDRELQEILDRFFNARGRFTGRLPDDFFHFMNLVGSRNDIHLGVDAVGHARQLANRTAQKIRSAEIQQQIHALRRIPGIKARLYPYQTEGVAFLAGTGRALLADDMGLGKTLQAISAAAWLLEHEGVRRILIICPASLKQQWAREIRKFTDLKFQVVQGTPGERGEQYRRECSFFIINYELLLRDLSLVNETVRPDLIILDEAQRIKNWRTKIAASVKMIHSRYAFVLTGTPLENRLEDLYSLMQVVDPNILGPLWRYMVDFHVMDKKGKILGYRNLSMLRQRLQPVMLRRDRHIVSSQLPERITTRIDVAMTPRQVELHDTALAAAGRLAAIARKRPLTPSEQNRLMAALQTARMACDAAGLVDKETEGSPKIDELMDILDQTCLQSGMKAVVFSQWETMTRMVEARLREQGIGYVRLHGGVPTAKRGPLMDRFRDDDTVQVFLSTDAGGVGLNLQTASVLVNLDVPWNPAVLEQRNARIHRLGQTRTVQIITMVAADSYEEHVLSLVQGKQDLFDNVVAGDGESDVVGVSKKLIEALVEDLAPEKNSNKKSTDAEKTVDATCPETVPDDTEPMDSVADQDMKKEITACIAGLQDAFGPRIERILGANGTLLAVLDHVDGEDDLVAEQLSQLVPVALIDKRTLAGLERIGAGFPALGGQTYYDAASRPGARQTSSMAFLAAEKIKAAKVLLEQQHTRAATELVTSALLAAAADRAGLETPVMPRDAGVWLHAEALPNGALTQEEATLVMRAISLAQAPSVPDLLCAELFRDADEFIQEITSIPA